MSTTIERREVPDLLPRLEHLSNRLNLMVEYLGLTDGQYSNAMTSLLQESSELTGQLLEEVRGLHEELGGNPDEKVALYAVRMDGHRHGQQEIADFLPRLETLAYTMNRACECCDVADTNSCYAFSGHTLVLEAADVADELTGRTKDAYYAVCRENYRALVELCVVAQPACELPELHASVLPFSMPRLVSLAGGAR